MKLRSALLVATILVAPVAAMAQPVTGLYVGAGAGFNYLDSPKIDRLSPFTAPGANSTGGNLTSSGGVVGVVSGGFGFGNGLRVELEGNFRYDHYKIKHLTVPNSVVGGPAAVGSHGVAGGGDLQTYGPMVNVLYDFAFPSLPIQPYVGVGGGYEFSSLQRASAYSYSGAPATLNLNNNAHGAAAVQAIIGAALPIPPVPGLALTVEYRFMTTLQDDKFYGHSVNGPITVGGYQKIGDQYNHSLLFGVRYNFGVGAPPPPPAQPVPAAVSPVARSYLVFFDWDRADLTARARQIIAEAASASTKVSYTKIQVQGNADRSGTPQYNQRLSLRRAETVAAELVRDGVPRTAIDIQAFGDTRPLVPTAAGVREPQNRRVEIIIQ